MYSELAFFDGAHFAHIAAAKERLRLIRLGARGKALHEKIVCAEMQRIVLEGRRTL
jgi:hypothetical protein